jgi:hypothetical protein
MTSRPSPPGRHRAASLNPNQVQAILARHLAELASIAHRLRAPMLRSASPASLGLVEDGLTTVLHQRGISSPHATATSPQPLKPPGRPPDEPSRPPPQSW